MINSGCSSKPPVEVWGSFCLVAFNRDWAYARLSALEWPPRGIWQNQLENYHSTHTWKGKEEWYLLSLVSRWLLRYSEGKIMCSNTEKLYTWFIVRANSVKIRCSLSMLGEIETVKWAWITGLALPASIWEGFVRSMTFRPLSYSRNTQPRAVHIDADFKGKAENSHLCILLYLSSPPPLPHSFAEHLPSSLFSLLWCRAQMALQGPGPHLVTMLRFFRWLSAPGLSLSGSPFRGVCLCFMVFLFFALLMVVAQCLGRSFRNKHKRMEKWDTFLRLPTSPSNNMKNPLHLCLSFYLSASLSFLAASLFLMGACLEYAYLLLFIKLSPTFRLKVWRRLCLLGFRSSISHPHPESLS